MIALQFILDLLFAIILWFLFASVHALTPEEEFKRFITRPLIRSFLLANLAGALLYLRNHDFILFWLHWIVMGLVSAVLFHFFYKHIFIKRFSIPAFLAIYTILHWILVLSVIKIRVYGSGTYQGAAFVALVAYFLQSVCILIVWKYSYRYLINRYHENTDHRH